jgi:hypothetical protein
MSDTPLTEQEAAYLERFYALTLQLGIQTQTVDVLGAWYDRLLPILRVPAWQQEQALRDVLTDMYAYLEAEGAALAATVTEVEALDQEQAGTEVLAGWRAFMEQIETSTR